MSQQVINHSPDVKKLRDQGFEVEIRGAYLLLHHVPYLNSDRKIEYGTLISDIRIAGNKVDRPINHVVHFAGNFPHNLNGKPIDAIRNVSQKRSLGNNIEIDHSFSNKPQNGYADYFEKMTRYIAIISAPAQALDSKVTAKTFKVIQAQSEEEIFNYLDTNSSRADIGKMSEYFKDQRIAIIGVGGTGSYILDFVAKTPVKEILLIDGDQFLQHNAFRAPGAPSIDELGLRPSKVKYFREIYSKMRKGIITYDFYLDEDKLKSILPIDFAFISIDDGEAKEKIIDLLQDLDIPFVDTGLGVENVENSLIANIRTTSSTSRMKDHIREKKRISFTNEEENLYTSNIQIAELNAANAISAVLKWKKYLGFYRDDDNEHHSVLNVNSNILTSDDFGA